MPKRVQLAPGTRQGRDQKRGVLQRSESAGWEMDLGGGSDEPHLAGFHAQV